MISANRPARRQFAVACRQRAAAVRWMKGINGPHELEVRSGINLNFHHRGALAGSIASGIIRYGTAVSIHIESLPDSYCVGVPIAGHQRFESNGEKFDCDLSTGAIISPGTPLRMDLSGNCTKLMARIDRSYLESLLSELIGRSLDAPLLFQARVDLEGKLDQWWLMVKHVHQSFLKDTELLDCPGVWPHLEKSLATGLLYAQPHNYISELKGVRSAIPQYLGDLESMMRNSLSFPLTLSDLEAASGVSRERLYRDFHDHYGQSPISFFRHLRFQAAKERLESPSPKESVSSVATDFGFYQLGRFSREYRSRFGELPSETLRRHQSYRRASAR